MRLPIRKVIGWSALAALGVGAAVALAASDAWLPAVRSWMPLVAEPSHDHAHPEPVHPVAAERPHEHGIVVRGHLNHDDEDHAHEDAHGEHAHHDHAGHEHSESEAAHDHTHEHGEAGHRPADPSAADSDHDHPHDDAAVMHLSAAAKENVGLKVAEVELSTFERTIRVPAMIVPRPGRTYLEVAAPFTGKVTRVWPLEGETVTTGQPLFELRLTHEDLVEAQSEFLKTAEERDVLKREVARLQGVAAQGVIAGKTMLQRKYELDKLEALLRSQREGLLLHGLTAAQVDGILADRSLVSNITIAAPGGSSERLLQVEELKVHPGQHVSEGQTLCVLADYAALYIEGKAFEDDIQVLTKAINADWRATAVIAAAGREPIKAGDLRIVYLANRIEPETRAFLFYVELPNRIVQDRDEAGHRFCDWQFRPGQRVQLLVPVERWSDRIVLPVDAVIQDGAEAYVFEEHEGHFDRRTVRVEYRDPYSAVLANDGSIRPGCRVVVAGAYQLHLAMKNKSGGGVDPHAGHRH